MVEGMAISFVEIAALAPSRVVVPAGCVVAARARAEHHLGLWWVDSTGRRNALT